jgi:hypothetical protein
VSLAAFGAFVKNRLAPGSLLECGRERCAMRTIQREVSKVSQVILWSSAAV